MKKLMTCQDQMIELCILSEIVGTTGGFTFAAPNASSAGGGGGLGGFNLSALSSAANPAPNVTVTTG